MLVEGFLLSATFANSHVRATGGVEAIECQICSKSPGTKATSNTYTVPHVTGSTSRRAPEKVTKHDTLAF